MQDNYKGFHTTLYLKEVRTMDNKEIRTMDNKGIRAMNNKDKGTIDNKDTDIIVPEDETPSLKVKQINKAKSCNLNLINVSLSM